MSVKLVQLAKGKVIGTNDIHLEELIPVDTNTPADYIATWDVSKGVNDKVTAYLTGSGNDLSLHIFGSGEMMDFTPISPKQSPYYTAPWASYSARIKHITIHDGITRVGQLTFCGANSSSNSIYSLSDVTISSTVRTVTRYFLLNTSVGTLNLNAGIRRIGEGAFCGKSSAESSLSSVSIPSCVRIIDYSAFSDTAWFRQLPAGYTSVGDGCVIQYNGNQTVLPIPEGTKCVSLYNWANKRNCTDVSLPDSLKYIATFAFGDFSSLTDIVIPPNCRKISSNAFGRCTGLQSVFIPQSVKSISSNSVITATGIDTSCPDVSPFYGCTGGLKIYCEAGSKPQGFGEYWDYVDDNARATVYWGISKQEYEENYNELEEAA